MSPAASAGLARARAHDRNARLAVARASLAHACPASSCPDCWRYGKAIPLRTPCPFCIDRKTNKTP